MNARPRLLALSLSLVASALLAARTGAFPIGAREALAIVASRVGLPTLAPFTDAQADVLLSLRLPRVLLGALVGASLAASGAALQGLLRNPLVDPGLLGISSGAALVTAAMLVLAGPHLAGAGLFAQPLAAFVGALAATGAVLWLGARGTGGTARVVLAGVAINALCGAATGALTFVADDAQLRGLTFWSMGSLGAASWPAVAAVAPFALASLVALPRLGAALDALALGESDAALLGVRVARVRAAVIALVALAVGAAVAFTGVVGFVGLVVPHLARPLLGVSHGALLVGSALLGASLLVLADAAARTLVAPAELPLGLVCAAAGAPFFAALLARRAGEAP